MREFDLISLQIIVSEIIVCVCVFNLYLVTKFFPGFQGALVHYSTLGVLTTKNNSIYKKRSCFSFGQGGRYLLKSR